MNDHQKIKPGNRKPNYLLGKVIMVHAGCWFLFIGYELGFLYYSSGKLEPLYIYLFYYTVNITFFYLHVKLLDQVFQSPRPLYVQGVLLFILLLISTILAKLLLARIFENPSTTHQDLFRYYRSMLFSNLFRTGYYAVLATFYWAAGHIAFFRKQSLESEKKQLLVQQEKSIIEIRLAETRNAYLQQQINPHMLFNSLNFIYNSVHKCSGEAAKSVLLLTDIMRFSLEGAAADGKTSLTGEIEQINNLIEINRQRFDEEVFLNTHVHGNIEGFRILPLILFTLTENIFKHGNLTNKQHPAMLVIDVSAGGDLRFYSKNLKKSKSNFQRNSSLGIQNIRTRMDFAYPGKYALILSEQETVFEATLNVIL